VAFVVMLAGPGVPGDQLLVEQTQAIAASMGVPREKVKSEAADERELLMLVKSSRDDATLENQMRAKLAGKMPEAQLGATIRQASTPWFRYFVNYDPAPVLERVRCPVLALIGEKDTQVPPQQNLPALRAALKAGGNKDFEVDEMPGLNHLFQPARTGAPAEYSQIETTISPLALDKIAKWMEIHTRAK
jgi:pimeloyl-ACP methyl ester carboxylesterase